MWHRSCDYGEHKGVDYRPHFCLKAKPVSKLAYIQFQSDGEADRGFRLLQQRFEIAIEENIYCVPVEALAVLDEAEVAYVVANLSGAPAGPRRSWRITRSVVPVVAL